MYFANTRTTTKTSFFKYNEYAKRVKNMESYKMFN